MRDKYNSRKKIGSSAVAAAVYIIFAGGGVHRSSISPTLSLSLSLLPGQSIDILDG